ncbi:MAG: cell wall hydrolase, partial [Lachnospiraceae bacterium]|nr:cell wall hydrolase [Lachnospiraceae bacterium]
NVSTEDETERNDPDTNELLQNSLFEFTENDESDNLKERMYYVASVLEANRGENALNGAATITPLGRETLGDMFEQAGSRTNTKVLKESESHTEEMTSDAETTEIQQTTEAVTQETTPPETVQEETMPPETVVPETVLSEPETQETVSPEPETAVYNAVNVEITDSDYYWLTKIVEAEAGNQDEIGKILVVNVIINRVKSDAFPNSIKSVIFQNNGRTYQFEPVKNERIYDMNPTENTISCIERALAGEDYSRGALYFTMRTSNKSWFNTSLTLLFVHGDHYFYTN